MIVEGVVKFDFEITLLTVSAVDGVHFCARRSVIVSKMATIANHSIQQMSELALKAGARIARCVVLALGGHGLFGVELFVTSPAR